MVTDPTERELLMPDVSPDDLTARLRAWPSPGFGLMNSAADRIDALSGDVARLTAELADVGWLLGPARMVLDGCAERRPGFEDEAARMAQRIVDIYGHSVTDEPPHVLVERDNALRERDEALALVAERDATIERLRDALAAIRPRPTTTGVADPATQMQHIARAVLADTAPTPETHVDHKTGPCKSCGTSWADCPDNEDDDTEFAGCCYGCAHPCEGSR